MKFSIITPTHKRPEQLSRCVNSVLNQTKLLPPYVFLEQCPTLRPVQEKDLNSEFETEIIIINDSPHYDYSIFENDEQIKKAIENKKIIYIKNEDNKGKNYSCNLALSHVVGDYVIFLDDDDWLSITALTEIYNNLNDKSIPWLATNRCYENKESLTKNKTHKEMINYFWDCMVFKRFSGDATHIIEANLAKSACFNTKIKNGKEWYYFAQLTPTFIYKDLNSTITNGYHDNGLSDKLQNKNKIQKLITTIYNLLIYMRLRVGKLIRIKNIHAANK